MKAVFLRWLWRGGRRRMSEVAAGAGGRLAPKVGSVSGAAGYFSNLGVRRVHMRSSWASGMLLTGMDALADSSSMT
jgi:hypothetical protein